VGIILGGAIAIIILIAVIVAVRASSFLSSFLPLNSISSQSNRSLAQRKRHLVYHGVRPKHASPPPSPSLARTHLARRLSYVDDNQSTPTQVSLHSFLHHNILTSSLITSLGPTGTTTYTRTRVTGSTQQR
jgi:hypothetical protein